MGQAFLIGPDHATTARALEALVPAEILGLPAGRVRYAQLLTAAGGILDDLLVTRSGDPQEDGALMLVVNAGRKTADYAHLQSALPTNVRLLRADHRALVALQGPRASAVLGRHCAPAMTMPFMSALSSTFDGIDCHISRTGYTGEDGYEISAKSVRMRAIVERLLADPDVKLAGLGARDSLRLEAGLPLHGHDIDETTSPVEAGLGFSIGRRRREQGGFPGATRVLAELQQGAPRLRVGIEVEGRIPAREGADILSAEGALVGRITSGGFSPTLDRPIAMGYLDPALATPGTSVFLPVRSKQLAARVRALPFVPHRYYRGE
jgi:aminomethyltransferase